MAVYVIGAGLAGLSAATTLVERGVQVEISEAAPQAGGRCRSFHDAQIDRVIDNGNHLILSGNDGIQAYLGRFGARDRVLSLGDQFPFVDRANDARFVVQPNEGRLPWWLFVAKRRVPGTKAINYLADMARLVSATHEATIADVLPPTALRRALWEPVAVSVLNTGIDRASAHAFAAMLRLTLMKGGAYSRPMVARDTLAEALVEPATAYLASRGSAVATGRRLRALTVEQGRVTSLAYADATVALGEHDSVVLAVPPAIAASLLPGLAVPDEDEPILNAHFAVPHRDGHAIAGVLGGRAHWVFRRPGLVSTTTSADAPRDGEDPASALWNDARAAFPDLPFDMPPVRVVTEKRATIAQTPAMEAKRPAPSAAGLKNLALAGDWTATGLPATIEGAIVSGSRAAKLVL
ncbi:hydroxysqualene dehydroxylase HpnE [Roseiterribacter gracilis]|uniref:Amine oxidase n=1 Tax=Roseiterribacter gracilis TaxID=2812848 RepID=A0A8S8X762_9PROT|nr:amine oxidase [Rhodospirillales bacterium TMPK1]